MNEKDLVNGIMFRQAGERIERKCDRSYLRSAALHSIQEDGKVGGCWMLDDDEFSM
jgi:hypothetical protein